MKTGRIFGIFVALTALIAAPAMAQDAAPKAPVEKAMVTTSDAKVVKTVTDENGETRTELHDTSLVVPGDRVVFRTNYRNRSSEPVENFVFTNKIPSAVTLASDADADLTVSVDDGKSWGLLADLSVSNEDGTARPAQTSDVTHVRKVLPLIEPGESGQIAFYVIVR